MLVMRPIVLCTLCSVLCVIASTDTAHDNVLSEESPLPDFSRRPDKPRIDWQDQPESVPKGRSYFEVVAIKGFMLLTVQLSKITFLLC